jgi:hypothetical protein
LYIDEFEVCNPLGTARKKHKVINQGFYIDRLGTCMKGTVLYVSDNLGAHSLAGFQVSFRVNKFCRFCLASYDAIQTVSVRDDLFPLRTKILHTEAVEQ